MFSSDPKTRTVSTKIDADELEKLDKMALARGVTRAFLLKELITAAFEGRVLLSIPPPIRGSLHDFAASDAGRAAMKKARNDAEAAVRDAATVRRKGLTTRKAGETG
ncbi:MAG: ribbon-helix-helix protein, CopG family [Thermoleophilia bacterium]|nr:ribbon-helix-helix protein, CopG family [Thermoleophilia bacterium]